MFNFFKKTSEPVETKSYEGSVLSDYPDGLLSGYNNDGFRVPTYTTASNDGFIKNYVVYRAITDIAEGGANIPLNIEDEQVKDFLRKPYFKTPYKTWMANAIKYKCLSGNVYSDTSYVGSKVKSMQLIRPDRMEVCTGNRNGLSDQLLKYQWTQGMTKEFPVDDELNSDIFHSRFFNPCDEWRGLSLLSAGMISVDQSNAMGAYNKKVVENNGSPSSLLVMKEPKDKMTPAPSEDQMNKLRASMDDKLGKNRQNSFAVVNWMYDAVRLGMTQQEMDWVNSKTTTAREIALALGYPPFLLGLADGATFNNVSEAKMSLYDNTIIPIVSGILDDFAMHWESITGKAVKISVDRENILALMPRLFEKRESARLDFQAGIISDVEARLEGNYPEEPKAGERYMPSSQVPLGMDFNLLENE
jgi:HK97 family phage portal protein